MSLTKLVLPAQIKRSYDADAAAYIAAVEAADGQSLESGVKDAITEFVIGCKTRGIWDAIKSCCLLCGARTLNGALVPLKGPAPTNFNFTNSDYSRETGLKGNGINQQLGTNFSSSSLGLNNIHFSIYLSSINSNSGPDGARTYISDLDRNCIRSGTGFGQIRINANLLSYDISSINNFIGCSRNNNSTFTLRLKNNDVSLSSLSSSFSSDQFRIFCRHQGNNIYREFSNGRIAFYSVGESLDLRLLDNNLKVFLDNIARVFDQSYTVQDADAANYIEAVRQIEGVRSMGFTYRQSIDEFVAGCKSDNIWNSITGCCVLVGAKNLTSALTPLKGVAPSKSLALRDSDYLSFLGVKGSTTGTGNSGDTKGIYTNYNNLNNLQNDFHISTFIMTPDSRTAEVVFMGVGQNQNGTVQLNSQGIRNMNGSRAGYSNNIGNTFYGTSRNNSSNFIFRINNTNTTVNQASQLPYDAPIIVLGAGVTGSTTFIAGFTDARLSFYSIGANLDLALLGNRVTRLVNNISSRRII